MKKGILILLILLIIIAGGFFLVKKIKPRENPDFIKLSGNIEVTEINPGFKTSGRISELFTDEGRVVEKNAKIAVIESTQTRETLMQSVRQLHESQEVLSALEAGSRPQEIAEAQASVLSAKADFQKCKKDCERTGILYKNGAVSASQMDAAKRLYEMALAQVKAQEARLSLVKEGPRKQDIEAARKRVKQIEAFVALNKANLKDTVLFSPIKGVVLKKNVEAGDIVAAGVPVFTLGDTTKPYVKVYVNEDKLGLVKLGQAAQVAVDTYPNNIYEGVVSYISSKAEFTPKNIQTQEERVKLVFEVKVDVKNNNDDLKPGMPADVKIDVGNRE